MAVRVDIAINNLQSRLVIDEPRLRSAVAFVLREASVKAAEISIAIGDDALVHGVNREFLNHDYPTDVVSFVLSDPEAETLEGEIVASADYAAAEAERYGWEVENELLLYVVHGALHLVGYDDLDPASAMQMREAERRVLAEFGLIPPGR